MGTGSARHEQYYVWAHCFGVIEGDSIPDQFIPKLVDLFQQGRFPIDQLITFYPLADIQSAVTDMENGKVIKPVLRP